MLKDVSGLTLLHLNSDRTHAYWLFTILVERREDFIKKLASVGIPSSVVHLRIDNNSIFGGVREDLTGQTEFNDKQVSLPVHEGLSKEHIEQISEHIKNGW